ncbi:hypothetical protein SMICM304S_08072 [Streptomyces microflavus]
MEHRARPHPVPHPSRPRLTWTPALGPPPLPAQTTTLPGPPAPATPLASRPLVAHPPGPPDSAPPPSPPDSAPPSSGARPPSRVRPTGPPTRPAQHGAAAAAGARLARPAARRPHTFVIGSPVRAARARGHPPWSRPADEAPPLHFSWLAAGPIAVRGRPARDRGRLWNGRSAPGDRRGVRPRTAPGEQAELAAAPPGRAPGALRPAVDPEGGVPRGPGHRPSAHRRTDYLGSDLSRRPARWAVLDLPAGPEHAAAIAVPGRPPGPHHRPGGAARRTPRTWRRRPVRRRRAVRRRRPVRGTTPRTAKRPRTAETPGARNPGRRDHPKPTQVPESTITRSSR